MTDDRWIITKRTEEDKMTNSERAFVSIDKYISYILGIARLAAAF